MAFILLSTGPWSRTGETRNKFFLSNGLMFVFIKTIISKRFDPLILLNFRVQPRHCSYDIQPGAGRNSDAPATLPKKVADDLEKQVGSVVELMRHATHVDVPRRPTDSKIACAAMRARRATVAIAFIRTRERENTRASAPHREILLAAHNDSAGTSTRISSGRSVFHCHFKFSAA